MAPYNLVEDGMKRRREPREEYVALLPENWALVRSHWALLILWDQWLRLLVVLKDHGDYLIGHHNESDIPPVGMEPHSYIVMIQLNQIRWHGNRIGALVVDAAVMYSGDGHCAVMKNYRVILKYADEDGEKAFKQECSLAVQPTGLVEVK